MKAAPVVPVLGGACNRPGCGGAVGGVIDAFCTPCWACLPRRFRRELLDARNDYRRNAGCWKDYAVRILGAGIWLARSAA